jgi:hypothetical protein
MTRRRFAAAAFVLVAVAPACNGDDDAVESLPPETSLPETTEPPPETTEAPTSTSTTVEPTTTTVDEEALKAQIAEDYLRAEQALEDLSRNPTLADLETKVAAIAVPGSESFQAIVAAVQQDVASGERLAAGEPDYSDVIVESVDVLDAAAGEAEVQACIISNQMRIGADGRPIGQNRLLAARIRQSLQLTPSGWLRSSPRERVSIEEGVTACTP